MVKIVRSASQSLIQIYSRLRLSLLLQERRTAIIRTFPGKNLKDLQRKLFSTTTSIPTSTLTSFPTPAQGTSTSTSTSTSISTQGRSAKMTVYNISITSDIVCPWCYIGHTRLNKAIKTHQETHPDDKFNLTYRPFYLNPAAQVTDPSRPAFPIESVDKAEFYASKFGPARAASMMAMMKQTMASEGIHLESGGRTGSSRNGHRLVHFAQGKGEAAQNKVMLGLWTRYFEQAVDITDLDVLVEVGVEANLGSESQVRSFLVSGEDAETVDALAEEARLEGISGVPFYVVQDLWAVEGAQEPRAFEALFVKWKEFEKINSKTTEEKDRMLRGGAAAGAATAAVVANGNSCL